MKLQLRFFLLLILILLTAEASADDKLTGVVIGTKECVDYNNTSKSTTTVNTCANAFDGNLNTYFASWERSYTWAGLDLGSPHVITRVGWSPRNDSQGEARVLLAVFEGANSPDFMDALPLYIVDEKGKIGQMSYADIDCSRGFRYVRYIGPSDARCNIAELEFYGYPDEGDDSHLYQVTNLPTVSIHTLNGEIPYDKEHQIVSQLTIISENGTKLLSESGTTRERGNASRGFPKKPYRIKFDTKQKVLDAPGKAKKWTLINNYGDKTLMRNLLAFELSKRIGMPYTPYGTAVDVLLNGEYKGCYQLCDQVQVHKHRVEITEMTSADNSGIELTGGYFIEIDAYADKENSWFKSNKGNPVTIKSPEEDSITTQQKNYIKSYFNNMESQWSTYLDTNTFLRHFLVGELSGNTDTYWSVFMYKDRENNQMYTGPVWDFDLAFDNDNRTYPVCSKSDYIYRSGGSCAGNMKTFVDNIVVKNATAKKQMLEIWDEARQAGLTEENLVAFIDSLETELNQSQRLNFLRWKIMNTKVHQNPKLWGSYTAEVQNVRRFMKERLAWMDKKLQYTYVPNAIATVRVNTALPYRVFTIAGQPCGNSLNDLRPGVYIIHQGTTSQKVIVR
ncbi:MAG: CotH kinase family protein [Bacteroidaceae bacterium]|nr:CotH kinase family protein [Bacteroidaceae bacterium]